MGTLKLLEEGAESTSTNPVEYIAMVMGSSMISLFKIVIFCIKSVDPESNSFLIAVFANPTRHRF